MVGGPIPTVHGVVFAILGPGPASACNSVAVRDAVQHRAARPAGVARVFHRHHALALADKHALTDVDGRFVADDDARMRRGQIRTRAIGPDDGVAREDPTPSVVATHIDALLGAGL